MLRTILPGPPARMSMDQLPSLTVYWVNICQRIKPALRFAAARRPCPPAGFGLYLPEAFSRRIIPSSGFLHGYVPEHRL